MLIDIIKQMRPDKSQDPPPTKISKPLILMILASVVVAALYLAMANNRFHFLEAAESGDILLARALAQGEGFREVWRLGKPPCTVRPPGFAFIMSLVVRIFSMDLLAMKVINNLFGVLGFLAALVLLRRRLDSNYLVLVLCFFSFTLPFWIDVSKYLYSGGAYTCFILFALAAFETADDREFGGRWLLLLFTALFAGSLMIRGAAIALPVAALISLLSRRVAPAKNRWTWAVAVVIAALLSSGAWTLRNYKAKGAQDQPYFSKLLVGEPPQSLYWLAEDQGVPLAPKPRPLTVKRLFRRLLDSGTYYLDHTAPFMLPVLEVAPRWLLRTWSAAGLFLIVAGLLLSIKKERRISELFALLTLGIAWLWPFPHPRFFAPVMPILLFAMVDGGFRMVKALNRSPSREFFMSLTSSTFLILGIVAIAINLIQDFKIVRDRFQEPEFKLLHSSGMLMVTSRPEAYRSLLILDYVRANTEPEASVMFHSIHPCGLVAQRICSTVPLARPDRVMDYIIEHGIDYVVADDEGGQWGASIFSFHFLLPAIRAHPERFEDVETINRGFEESGSRARLFKVVPAKSP